jgi:hypothetical protein
MCAQAARFNPEAGRAIYELPRVGNRSSIMLAVRAANTAD